MSSAATAAITASASNPAISSDEIVSARVFVAVTASCSSACSAGMSRSSYQSSAPSGTSMMRASEPA